MTTLRWRTMAICLLSFSLTAQEFHSDDQIIIDSLLKVPAQQFFVVYKKTTNENLKKIDIQNSKKSCFIDNEYWLVFKNTKTQRADGRLFNHCFHSTSSERDDSIHFSQLHFLFDYYYFNIENIAIQLNTESKENKNVNEDLFTIDKYENGIKTTITFFNESDTTNPFRLDSPISNVLGLQFIFENKLESISQEGMRVAENWERH